MVYPQRGWAYLVLLLFGLLGGLFLGRHYLQERALHSLPYGFTKFSVYEPAPPCGRWKKHMPSQRDPAAYRLYIEARKVWRSKLEWELTHEEAMRILTDVRKAADLGDWGARALLARFYLYGLGVRDLNRVLEPAPEKAIEIQRAAEKAGQPWALYDLGVAYENGYGGVPYDGDIAWAYFLRAAQLGSPEAQMALAEAYGAAGRLDDEGAMLRCAYEQGHGAAAYKLAIRAEVKGAFKDAIQKYQDGVKFGSSDCSVALWLLFEDGNWPGAPDAKKDELRSVGIAIDSERGRRYSIISDALKVNPDLKLTRLDSVLPLPPTQLPAWEGIDDAVEPESNGPPKY